CPPVPTTTWSPTSCAAPPCPRGRRAGWWPRSSRTSTSRCRTSSAAGTRSCGSAAGTTTGSSQAWVPSSRRDGSPRRPSRPGSCAASSTA
ncbi:MAG: hypothetical protein AVDCRST_MAG66-4536, partial [uncultured Pseudonocardia sp.]